MNYYIGADLGTSSLKILLVAPDGRIVKEVSRKYPVSFPHPGWSEQEPQAWWDAFVSAVRELNAEYGKDIKGIAAGGQMHGLVALDRADNVIRP
ncbi:MAG: xylulokinase, partial [Clostridia bacterium]|nr:xylulokinase [Clostridia bacterium]